MQIETLFSLASGVVSLVALVFSVGTHFSVLRRDRRQATLEAYNHLEESVLEPFDKIMPMDIEQIVKNKRSAEYKTIKSYVARIEHFCVGINHKIYDFNVAYDMSHGFLDGRIYERVKRVIEGNEDFYKNTIDVIGRMLKKGSAHNKMKRL